MMPLLGLFKGNGPSGFGYASTARDVVAALDLTGRTYLVTGTRTGLGLETVAALAGRGAYVIAMARAQAEAQSALAGRPGLAVACDLSEPASVRAALAAVKGIGRPIDGIVCNAGVMAPATLQTKHGLEIQFLTNHLGHYVLVTGLLDTLAPNGRVVVVSSAAHLGAPPDGIAFDNLDGARGYAKWVFYGQSKLANILFAKALAKRLTGSGRTANALHPGVIRTELGRHMSVTGRMALTLVAPLVLKTIPQGAATQCYVAAHPAVEGVSGEYFADCNVATPSRHARDEGLGERLWARTEELAGSLAHA